MELLVAADLGRPGPGFEAGLGTCFQHCGMAAQSRGWRQTEDKVEAVGPAEIDDLGTAIVAVATDKDLRGGPVGPDGAEQAPRKRRISTPLGRLAGRNMAVTNRPSPSKTTIGWKPYSS